MNFSYKNAEISHLYRKTFFIIFTYLLVEPVLLHIPGIQSQL